MGKYMSTTITPINKPITVIISGSISRVTIATQRDK